LCCNPYAGCIPLGLAAIVSVNTPCSNYAGDYEGSNGTLIWCCDGIGVARPTGYCCNQSNMY